MNGFELIEERYIQELNSWARLYRHAKTGARLLSLENDDENKVFAITFRTPPVDSTGVAHILEHSVLAGSEKYPLKDPFREIAKGSLNTFLNAFTFPDKTCYPVASQNLQDFYNLIDVYVDSVFHPLIHPETLQQEGWRYDLEHPDAPLTFKGVVFNEMKGAYSSPDNVLDRFSQQSLFPNHTYGVDSGGDPKDIPNLIYEQFKDFHTRYYHPSNAYIYFYGDDDSQERLRLMDSYLQEFEPLEVDSTIGLHPGIDKPQQLVIPYDAGQDGERKAYLTVNWLLPDTLDPERTFTYNILNYILVGTPASPLRKELVDSGLGEDLAGGGLEAQLRQMMFSTGLKGVAIEDLDRVETLIFKTLQKLAQEGIDPDTTVASVNTIEFRLRENNTGAMPRGLIVMLRALTTWLYDGDPFNALAFEAPLSSLKARLAAGEPVFEDLIRVSFLDNQHRTVLILQPDASVRQREETEERERLERARAGMAPGDIQAIIEANKILKEHQETPDSPETLATIPSLKLADLDRQIKTIPLEVVDLHGSRVLYHDLFTNGIVYLDLGFRSAYPSAEGPALCLVVWAGPVGIGHRNAR
jgi:Zn-dependent M16 (insulinase) family peptidase